jgi:hypothetical protein
MKYLHFFSKHSTRYLVAATVLVVSVISPLQVFALSPADYSSNDVLFFTPGSSCSSKATAATTTTVKLDQNDPVLKQIFTLLIQTGQFNSVQAAAIMGNMAAESHFNSDAHEPNGIGYGLVQWSFGRRIKIEAFAKQKGVAASDIPMQIEYLAQEYTSSYKANLASTAFGKGTDVAAATSAWMDIFEAPDNTPPSKDKPRLQTVRIPTAIQVYGFFKDIAPTSGATVGSQDCTTTNAIVAGSIVQTAINLALPQPVENKTAKSDASAAYQKVKDQYNPTVDWTDCGGYIATVMISSGVDVNYPKVSVAAQVQYVSSHPEKYQIITNPTAADLQAGDILLSNSAGHTTLYLGTNSTGYPAADASLNQRVPSLRPISNSTWMLSNGAIIARFIGQTK